jgi:hypothetical protein
VALEELVVVHDDPVVDPHDRPVANGVVVRGDRRVTLCVVTHVNERLDGFPRDRDLIEERARAGALLVDLDRAARAAVGVPDGVGAALGDPGEQRLGRERPVDGRGAAQAIAGDAAHQGSILGFSAVDTVPSRRIGRSKG